MLWVKKKNKSNLFYYYFYFILAYLKRAAVSLLVKV